MAATVNSNQQRPSTSLASTLVKLSLTVYYLRDGKCYGIILHLGIEKVRWIEQVLLEKEKCIKSSSK